MRLEEREGVDTLPDLNPPENLLLAYTRFVCELSVDVPLDQFVIKNKHQSKSIHGKRRTNADPVIKHTERARSATPVNVELPPHVLVSDVEGKESRAGRIAVLRRDIFQENGEKTTNARNLFIPTDQLTQRKIRKHPSVFLLIQPKTMQPLWHFLHINKWQLNLLLFNIILQSSYLQKKSSSIYSDFTVSPTPPERLERYIVKPILPYCFWKQ